MRKFCFFFCFLFAFVSCIERHEHYNVTELRDTTIVVVSDTVYIPSPSSSSCSKSVPSSRVLNEPNVVRSRKNHVDTALVPRIPDDEIID